MGGTQSNQSPQGGQGTWSKMTFDQLLYKVSHKVSELQEVLNNMKEDRRKRERLPEYQAIQLMAEALRNAETELRQLNISLTQPANQQGEREQQLYHARQQYPKQQHGHASQQYPQQQSSQARQQCPKQQPGQEKLRYPEHHNVPNEHPTGTPRDTPSLSNSGASQTQQKHSKAELSSTPKSLEEFRKENTALKTTVDELAKRNDEHKKEAQKMRDENRILLQRLSKLTSDKLTADNPNIADLSDPNRPTKLVEMMSELYDNQWTDAYVALQPLKNDDKLVVKILLQTFMDIYNFCKDKSRSLVTMTEKTMKDLFEDVNATMKKKDRIVKTKSATLLCRGNEKGMAGLIREQSFDESNIIFLDWQHEQTGNELEESGSFKEVKDVWPKVEGELKKARKDFGVAMVPIVTKAYLKPRWSKSCVKELKPYIKRCFYVAWMMCVQTPPMALAALPRQGDIFDVNLYTAYSKRGNKVDFVVWPAVLLKEQQVAEAAVVMRKGVADGKD